MFAKNHFVLNVPKFKKNLVLAQNVQKNKLTEFIKTTSRD
jgi:hypothetical protein